jgi:hypothetical protein
MPRWIDDDFLRSASEPSHPSTATMFNNARVYIVEVLQRCPRAGEASSPTLGEAG